MKGVKKTSNFKFIFKTLDRNGRLLRCAMMHRSHNAFRVLAQTEDNKLLCYRVPVPAFCDPLDTALLMLWNDHPEPRVRVAEDKVREFLEILPQLDYTTAILEYEPRPPKRKKIPPRIKNTP